MQNRPSVLSVPPRHNNTFGARCGCGPRTGTSKGQAKVHGRRRSLEASCAERAGRPAAETSPVRAERRGEHAHGARERIHGPCNGPRHGHARPAAPDGARECARWQGRSTLRAARAVAVLLQQLRHRHARVGGRAGQQRLLNTGSPHGSTISGVSPQRRATLFHAGQQRYLNSLVLLSNKGKVQPCTMMQALACLQNVQHSWWRP